MNIQSLSERITRYAPIAILITAFNFAAAGEFHLPDATTGQINGKPAILFWPVDDKTSNLLDPSKCQVHAVRRGTTNESVFPCGQWFVPPVGGYEGWLESDEWISIAPIIFSFGGGEFKGAGTRVKAPVMPAADVAVIYRGATSDTDTIHLLSLDGPGHPLQRRATVPDAQRGLRMPARRVLVGIFDANDDAIALSQPVEVAPLRKTTVTLDTPKGSDVLAVLDRPREGKKWSPATAQIFITAGTQQFAPDFMMETPARIFATWYNLSAPTAQLAITSDELALAPVSLALHPRKVSTIRTSLALKGDMSSAGERTPHH